VRRAAGKTQRDLGEDIGRSANTIAKYEQGVITPTVFVLGAIARACRVDVGDLYDPDDPNDEVARLTAELREFVRRFPPLDEQQRSEIRAALRSIA
jgi:transcriptional regulator with XRE-family HTH domain